MNILIGNEGNKIEVVADPNVLAGYRFVAERTSENSKTRNRYNLVVYLGNVKVLIIKIGDIQIVSLPNYQPSPVMVIKSGERCFIENNQVTFDGTMMSLCLSPDHITNFKSKFNDIKQIFNRDVVLSLRYFDDDPDKYRFAFYTCDIIER